MQGVPAVWIKHDQFVFDEEAYRRFNLHRTPRGDDFQDDGESSSVSEEVFMKFRS